jgi:hypothetical protein
MFPDCDAIRYAEWFDYFDDPRIAYHDKAPVARLRGLDYCLPERQLAVAGQSDQAIIERTFRRLVASFWREAAHLSSPSAVASNPSYKAIVDLGNDVVPYLLRDMQQNRRTWFPALALITQENPVSAADAGKTDRMIEAWLRWGKAKGRLLT